ncbi:unnamed protein product [Pseudo-nitzschia multistriata]|uniref:PDZ domain-containing protein n=1 Tax=Pseudo-nitzschia multistriata TaxID=183589 RepID=A0A448ZLQ3_9STRA|nr:unnamed protein product [Pseudo-nitzschia multistriata]
MSNLPTSRRKKRSNLCHRSFAIGTHPVACFAAIGAAIALVSSPLPCHGFSTLPIGQTDVAAVECRKRWNRGTTDDFLNSRSSRRRRASDLKSISDSSNNSPSSAAPPNNWKRLATSVFAAILSVAISAGGPASTPVSPMPCNALTPDQLLVDDVWREVSRQYVDPTFNGQGEQGWAKQRSLALGKVADLGPDDDAQLYRVIRGMLQTLNDPYTRFLTPDQFEAMTKAYATPGTGRSEAAPAPTAGIGVQLIGDNGKSTASGGGGGMVVVVNTIAKSPAETAGILPGDKIRSVDGVDMVGATAEVVAAKCRGAIGTSVSIEIERPAIEGSPATATEASPKIVTVTRTPIAPTPMIEASTSIVSPSNQKVGVVKINSFTKETEAAVRQELKNFVRESGTGASSEGPPAILALDLRGNVGGYMPAGVDVAKLFLPPRARIVSEVDKTGRATIYINDGIGSETDTSTPLYLIVDRRTASASEILAAALQDNARAKVVSSDDRTFGKGRIQNVQALSYGGSGIAVTKAKYTTPGGRDIQGVGISPDLRSGTCTAKDSAAVCLGDVL